MLVYQHASNDDQFHFANLDIEHDNYDDFFGVFDDFEYVFCADCHGYGRQGTRSSAGRWVD